MVKLLLLNKRLTETQNLSVLLSTILGLHINKLNKYLSTKLLDKIVLGEHIELSKN